MLFCPNDPLNCNQQNKKQALMAYCSDIYTVLGNNNIKNNCPNLKLSKNCNIYADACTSSYIKESMADVMIFWQ